MKRLLSILLVIGLLVSVTGSVFASGLPNRTYDRRISTYVMVKDNSSPGGTYTRANGDWWGKAVTTSEALGAQYVSAATISNQDRILGWSIQAMDLVSGATVALYDVDATNVALAEAGSNASNMIAEAELGQQGNGYNEPFMVTWFPYPKKLTNRLLIMVGPENAIVTIYYEDISAIGLTAFDGYN